MQEDWFGVDDEVPYLGKLHRKLLCKHMSQRQNCGVVSRRVPEVKVLCSLAR